MSVYPYVCICMCLCLIVHVRPYCSSACAPLYYYSGFFQQDLFHPFQSLPGPEWPRVSRALLPLHTCFLFKPDFPTLAPPPLTHNLFSLPLFSAFNLSIWRVRTLFSLSLPLSPLCVCVCVCMYVRVYVYVHTHTRTHRHTHTHARTQTYTHTCTHRHTHTHTHTHLSLIHIWRCRRRG